MSGETNEKSTVFTPIETDTIGEIMNISMGSAATAASTLLDNKVTITTPIVNIIPIEQFDISKMSPAIAVEIQYVEGISGSNILILKRADLRVILSKMMMTELPEDFEVDEMAESAICELMNQMMGSSATVLSCFLGRTINISTPQTVPISEPEAFKQRYFAGDDMLVSIEFTLTIQDTVESIFLCAMKVDLAREIINVSLNFDGNNGDAKKPAGPAKVAPPPPPPPPIMGPGAAPQPVAAEPAPPPPPPPPVPSAVPEPAAAYAPGGYPPPATPYPAAGGYPPPPPPYGYPPPQPAGYDQPPVAVKEYNYGDFSVTGGGDNHPLNLDLVMNVPVVMTVELGRTRRKIKEILEFGQGTIVELDKQAGSQVDVIVNGQLIAHGDVVVVDDNFSIRITEIIKNKDPLSML